jgi:hypothetical protein
LYEARTRCDGEGKVGYYKTVVAARKYLDGVESTYLSEDAFKEREKERKVKVKGDEEIQEAIALLQPRTQKRGRTRKH